MDLTRIRFVVIVATVLLPLRLLTAEVICDKVLPLKPLRCVCGKLTDATGAPVPDAMVTVLKDGIEVAHMKSGQNGKFTFSELKPGSYELDARSAGYRPFRSPIVVAKPEKRCRHRLPIFLDTSGLESCGSRVMKQ